MRAELERDLVGLATAGLPAAVQTAAAMSSDEWLFDLMKQYWMDPCTAVVRPYSPAELQAHNLCAAVPPMIFMFALVGFVSLMAYLQSRGEQQKQKKS